MCVTVCTRSSGIDLQTVGPATENSGRPYVLKRFDSVSCRKGKPVDIGFCLRICFPVWSVRVFYTFNVHTLHLDGAWTSSAPKYLRYKNGAHQHSFPHWITTEHKNEQYSTVKFWFIFWHRRRNMVWLLRVYMFTYQKPFCLVRNYDDNNNNNSADSF